MIPGLALENRETRDLLVPLGRRADEREIAVLGEHDDVAAGEHDLPVAVPSAFPSHVPRRRVEAGENRFIETVDESIVKYRARKPVLHPVVAPDFPHVEPLAFARDFDERGTHTVARRDEDA